MENKPLSEMGKFAVVVVDPPWPVSALNWNRNGKNYAPMPYPTMTLPELNALPVGKTLADDSLLFCWATNKFIGDAIELLNVWGASYWFTMTWVKGGGPQAPNTPAFNAEFCVVGKRGNPQFRETKAFSTANFWPRGAHSEKPEGFYDLLRRVTPPPPIGCFQPPGHCRIRVVGQ